jgi:hypothetical protein
MVSHHYYIEVYRVYELRHSTMRFNVFNDHLCKGLIGSVTARREGILYTKNPFSFMFLDALKSLPVTILQ